jgi:hypothetical protein
MTHGDGGRQIGSQRPGDVLFLVPGIVFPETGVTRLLAVSHIPRLGFPAASFDASKLEYQG